MVFTSGLIIAIVLVTVVPVFAHPNCMADVIIGQQHARRLSTRAETGTEFGYEGAKGPAFWASLNASFAECSAGEFQSPINFEDNAMLDAVSHNVSWSDSASNLSFVNNGHTIQVNMPKSAGFSLTAGGDPQRFDLAQFHFHSPSEHHRRDKAFAVEAHFVHTTANNDIAVLGMWFQLGRVGSPFIESVLAGGVPKPSDGAVTIPQLDFTSMKEAISAKGATFWSYSGSLTTPPCTQGVKWSVLDQPLTVSVSQMRRLQAAMPFNARPTAPVGSRNSPGGVPVDPKASKTKTPQPVDPNGLGSGKPVTNYTNTITV